ncbi:MAG: hypothetical protein AB7I30_10985, partial [Isosphaeraceae bacterium]
MKRALIHRPRNHGAFTSIVAGLALTLAMGLTSGAIAGGKGRAFKLDANGVLNQTTFSILVSGQATHLGRFTAVGQITANVTDPENPGFFLRSGYLNFTAANGDVLAMSFEDALVDGSTGTALGVFVVEGG